MSTGRKDARHHTTEYDSAVKNEVLTHATPWVNVKNIRLSDISQIQKDTLYNATRMIEQIHMVVLWLSCTG